ncbi:hypothetical protein D9M73_155980 [compost metagenome]
MADAEAARAAREATVGDQRNLFAQPKAIKRSRGRKHLTHAGAALRPFIADDDDFALVDQAPFHCRETLLLAIEHARRSGELEPVHPRDLHDRAIGGERTAQANHAAPRRQRRLDVVNDLLVGVPGDLIDILAERLTRHRQAVAVEEAAFQHRLHQHVDATGLIHILGDILTTGFEIGDIRR